MTYYISIITRHPDKVADYLGFGAVEISRGVNSFGDACLILQIPSENAEWQAGRLCSGLHCARIHPTTMDLDAWKEDFGYQPDSRYVYV